VVLLEIGIGLGCINSLVKLKHIEACLVFFLVGFRKLRIHPKGVITITNALFKAIEIEIADSPIGVERWIFLDLDCFGIETKSFTVILSLVCLVTLFFVFKSYRVILYVHCLLSKNYISFRLRSNLYYKDYSRIVY